MCPKRRVASTAFKPLGADQLLEDLQTAPAAVRAPLRARDRRRLQKGGAARGLAQRPQRPADGALGVGRGGAEPGEQRAPCEALEKEQRKVEEAMELVMRDARAGVHV